MTKAELIKALEEYPDEAEVLVGVAVFPGAVVTSNHYYWDEDDAWTSRAKVCSVSGDPEKIVLEL